MEIIMYIAVIITAVISYLIGSINSSILISRGVSGEDIRKSGSGNAGATNMLRTHGKKMGAITLLCDVAKGVIAILLARLAAQLLQSSGDGANTVLGILPYIAGTAVVIGHDFPVFFGFKGGKGVATSLGVMLMLDWQVGLIVLAVSVAVIAVTRYVSLGSAVGAVLFVIGEILRLAFFDGRPAAVIFAVIVGGLLLLRHRMNIVRLTKGEENKLGAQKNKQK